MIKVKFKVADLPNQANSRKRTLLSYLRRKSSVSISSIINDTLFNINLLINKYKRYFLKKLNLPIDEWNANIYTCKCVQQRVTCLAISMVLHHVCNNVSHSSLGSALLRQASYMGY
ncbi:hypothetical protein DL897_14820 [Thermoflavimicrobium daqui]|uniref:Uncharacterized protein n=1 Tax=Thermoflavimicrobium daqui TaxID=2137476 RepID=A0A364K282_9BACL|nr:hypothetical protein DL897_14820 [Thermoflavimicrobium daqui]